MRAVKRGREHLLIRRRTRRVVGRRGVVVNFAKRRAFASPAALERARIHVVHQHALVQKSVWNVELARVFVELECGDTRRKNVRLLVILFHFRCRHLRSAMAKVPQEFAVFCEFDDAVARHRSGDPHIFVPIHADGLQSARPAGNVILATPGSEHAAIRVEFHDLGTEDAAFRARRRGCRAQLIGPCVRRAIDHPDVVFLVHVDVHDLLHAPFVWQPLGPKRIDLVLRRVLRMRRRTAARNPQQDKRTAMAEAVVHPIRIGIDDSSFPAISISI